MTEAPAPTCSATELGAALGLSARRVRELAEAGVLPRHGRGRFDLEEARAAYMAHLRETAAGRAAAAGDGLDLVAERARLARAQADRQELELAVRRGQLVDAQEVRLKFVGMVTAARNRILGVPSKLKGRLPHLTMTEVEVMEDLLSEALIGLAGGDQ